MKLTELKEGTYAQIREMHMDQKTKMRLRHIGMYEGAKIKMERSGRKGYPCMLLVCGNFLMLRYLDGERIEVKQ